MKNSKKYLKKESRLRIGNLLCIPIGRKTNQNFRIGLSVSKKVGNAVARNRIKRYLRQSFLEMKDELRNDMDYVIIARHQAATLDFHETKKSLQHVLTYCKSDSKEVEGNNMNMINLNVY